MALICDQPEALGSPEYAGAAKIFAASFPVERLTKLGLSNKALAWLPEFGPCGGPGSPLLVAFFASVARDSITAQKDQVIYRAWKTVLKHYAYLRKSAPDQYPEIPALEEMTRKEKTGSLLREALALEQERESKPAMPTRGNEP